MTVAVLLQVMRVGWTAEVAAVMHLPPKRLQGRGQTRRAQRLRPLTGAGLASTDIGRGTDEGDIVLQCGRHVRYFAGESPCSVIDWRRPGYWPPNWPPTKAKSLWCWPFRAARCRWPS